MKVRIILAFALACLVMAFLLPIAPAQASGGPGYHTIQCNTCYCSTSCYNPIVVHHKPPTHHPKPPRCHHRKPPVHHHPKPPVHHHPKPHKPPVPFCKYGTVIYEVHCRGFNELIVIDLYTGKVHVYHVV